jgi:hypothetical protein
MSRRFLVPFVCFSLAKPKPTTFLLLSAALRTGENIRLLPGAGLRLDLLSGNCDGTSPAFGSVSISFQLMLRFVSLRFI